METLKQWIERQEGRRQFLYKCTANKWSIGVGHNIEDNGLSMDEIDYIFNNDINRAITALERYDFYNIQPKGVKEALVNMCFNIGITRLLGFKKMIEALKERDYNKAALEALDSKWASQVPKRAKEVVERIKAAV